MPGLSRGTPAWRVGSRRRTSASAPSRRPTSSWRRSSRRTRRASKRKRPGEPPRPPRNPLRCRRRSRVWRRPPRDLSAQIEKADEAKRPALEAKKSESDAALEQKRPELAAAQEEEKASLAEIEQWYEAALAEAQARFDARVQDLDWIQQERQRLFAVIDDPAQELTEEVIGANVDSSIARTRELLEEQTAAVQARNEAYDQRRTARIEAARQAIAEYEKKIEAEVGPRRAELTTEIEALKAQKASLEQADPKANKPQIVELDKQIAAKDKELQGLLTDPYLKRLGERVAAKNAEIQQIEADMAAMDQAAEKETQEANLRAEKEIKAFEELRAELARELKKAKLKRELDVLSARKEKGAERPRPTTRSRKNGCTCSCWTPCTAMRRRSSSGGPPRPRRRRTCARWISTPSSRRRARRWTTTTPSSSACWPGSSGSLRLIPP